MEEYENLRINTIKYFIPFYRRGKLIAHIALVTQTRKLEKSYLGLQMINKERFSTSLNAREREQTHFDIVSKQIIFFFIMLEETCTLKSVTPEYPKGILLLQLLKSSFK